MIRTILLAMLVMAAGATHSASSATHSASSAIQPDVNKATIKQFVDVSKDESYFHRSAFEIDLAAELKAHNDLDTATRTLSQKYGLAPNLMNRFARIWIQWVLHRQDAWPEERRSYQDRENARGANFAEIRKALITLAHDARHLPLVVEHAAAAIAAGREYGQECELSEFTELVSGAANLKLAVWTAATHAGNCEAWRIAGLAQFPDSPAMMWNVLDRPTQYGSDTRHDQRFAIVRQIETTADVRGLQGPDAVAMQTTLARRTISYLWNAGLVEDGIAHFEKQSESVRKNLVEERQPTPTIMLDGLSVDLKVEAEGLKPDKTVYADDFRVDLAAALYVVGREADALALYRTFPHPDKAAEAWLCDLKPDGTAGECEQQYADDAVLTMRALELSLVKPKDDPYAIVEMDLGDTTRGSPARASGLWLRLFRKRLNEPAYAWVLPDLSSEWRLDYADYDDRAANALDKALVPQAQAQAQGFRRKVQGARTAMGLSPDFPKIERRTVQRTTPIASSAMRFAERPTAPKCTQPKRLPSILSAVPEGFGLVRAERDGDNAVAISLSQNLDPAGEVSGGGYWVHLSSDGGKTWSKTLYTGLAQFFPYAVKPSSCRKMLAVDHLEIEVARAELDRGSITYPPVALRTKGQTEGLYLEIPIAELEKDTDGDLITDIEEEHLLLNPAKADSDGDGLNDGIDALPNIVNAKSSTETDRVMALVLGKIFDASFGAIIEGVDNADKPLDERLAGPRARDHVSPNRPIFVQGKASDYAGIRPPAMMLVYSDEQIAQLETMTPIFHAVQLWPLIMNRDRSRGFVKWSARWVGGTIGITREGSSWKVEDIAGWIT